MKPTFFIFAYSAVSAGFSFGRKVPPYSRSMNERAEDDTVGHEKLRKEIKRLSDEILEAL